MQNDINQLDPEVAWTKFLPTKSQPWNRTLAAHLYRRAGLSATSKELDTALLLSPEKIVDQLFGSDKSANLFDKQMESFGQSLLSTNNPQKLSAWWLYRMMLTPTPAREKLTLFWHGHFATSAAKVDDAEAMLTQHELLRRGSLGRFEKMIHAISRDPAMLIYLDSTTNRKTHPNENFARELMELFCLGVGNYTEKDIQQLARCFTGWEVYRDKFRFNKYQHDSKSKTLFGRSGNFDGDQAVKIVLAQPSAARFIVTKLVRYYVCDEPQLPQRLLEPLAQQLRDNQFEIGPVVRRILSSKFFFSEHAIGRKIRSPVELGVGLVRSLEATTNVVKLAESLDKLGQAVFFPPNVKGWPGGRAWINSSSLLGRANLVRQMVYTGGTKLVDGKLEKLADLYDLQKPEQAVDWLLDLLVAVPVPNAVRAELIAIGRNDPKNRKKWLPDMICAIGTLPEFQMN